MSLESQIADLVTATTALTTSVNTRMDQVVATANAVAVSGKTITNSSIDGTAIGQNNPAPITGSIINVNNGGTINAAGGIGTCPQVTCVSAPMGRIGLYANSTNGVAVGVPPMTVGLATQEAVPMVFATSGTERMRLDPSGNLLLGVSSANCHSIYRPSTEGAIIAQIFGIGSVVAAEFRVVGSLGINGAPAGVMMGKNSVTGRSLNAGGTLNASGADYAEYEYKKASCSSILAGQIIGFDNDGLITDRFESAVSFAIKSTNPSIVGGDSWGDETVIGAQPVEPKPLDLPGLRAQPQLPDQSQFDEVAEYAVAVAAHQSDHAKWRDEQFAHAQLTLAAELKHTTAMQEYQSALEAWTTKLEAARATVDRIAYCGKVPVNLTGAKIGDFLLPILGKDGGISGKWVAGAELDKVPGDYRRAIGQVRKLLPDGRALVVVKPI